MKLYYAPGACSLSPHIVLREAGYTFELEQVNNREKKTIAGADYWGINAKGQVPVLELDDGERISECPVILQYLADGRPEAGLIPAHGTMARIRLQEWLNFITSELHKGFSPLFRPTTPDAYKDITKDNLGKRFDWIDKQLAARPYLTGDTFTIADAYMFVVLRWSERHSIDMSKWRNIGAFMDRVAARPNVRAAMVAEGLVK